MSSREDPGPPVCQRAGCTAPVTHNKSKWVSPEHMKVCYFCSAHAPPDAEPNEIYCRECGEECVVNNDGTANHVFDDLHERAGEIDHDRDADHVPVPDTEETL